MTSAFVPGTSFVPASNGGGGSGGGSSALSGNSLIADVPIANAEAVIISLAVPANSLVAGDSFVFYGVATQTGAAAALPTFRVRVGSVTLTGVVAVSLTGVSGAGGFPIQISGMITFQAVGAGGTVSGVLVNCKPDGGGYDLTSRNINVTPVAVDTTQNLLIELTAISNNAGITYTFQNAIIAQQPL